MNDYAQLSEQIRLDGLQPKESVKFYNGAQIVINLHRGFDHSGIGNEVQALSVNPRTFEVNACGAFQLTDRRQDLEHFYQPGSEIETYSSAKELIEKIFYYLAHESERQEIAFNGLRKTVERHTFVHRLFEMLTLIFGPGQSIESHRPERDGS